MIRTKILLGMMLFVLTACAYGRADLGDGKYTQASAIFGQGGVYKVGNPYKIMGKWYYPKEDYDYSEVGVASWYGADFHAKKTANGERYDMNSLTAAHRTLPLPSIVKVTNLQNGRSLVLRVNDRGPYAKSRIIDVSKRAAQLLGFQAQGTTKVRVEVMEKESKALKAALTGQRTTSVKTANAVVQKKAKPVQKAQSYQKGSYFVQVGSFSRESSAQDAAMAVGKGSNIYYVNVNGKNYYRVRMGPFAARSEAEIALSQMQSKGVYDAKIVTD